MHAMENCHAEKLKYIFELQNNSSLSGTSSQGACALYETKAERLD